jgi:hypothetical protein
MEGEGWSIEDGSLRMENREKEGGGRTENGEGRKYKDGRRRN